MDATAAKDAAIAAEVARGPLPIKRHRGEGPFAPQLMPVGLFDSDEPGERWAAHPDYAPSEVLVSNRGRVRKRGRHAGVGEYEYFTLGSLRKDGYRRWASTARTGSCTFSCARPSTGPSRRARTSPSTTTRTATAPTTARTTCAGRRPRSKTATRGRTVRSRPASPSSRGKWEAPTTPSGRRTRAPRPPARRSGFMIGNISKVCNPEKTDKHTAGGYEFRHAPPPEDQGDLPWEELGPPHARFCVPRERWKLDPESDGRTRVSTRGRVQTKTPPASAGPSGTRRGPRAAGLRHREG